MPVDPTIEEVRSMIDEQLERFEARTEGMKVTQISGVKSMLQDIRRATEPHPSSPLTIMRRTLANHAGEVISGPWDKSAPGLVSVVSLRNELACHLEDEGYSIVHSSDKS